jgi:hypothetical protein
MPDPGPKKPERDAFADTALERSEMERAGKPGRPPFLPTAKHV